MSSANSVQLGLRGYGRFARSNAIVFASIVFCIAFTVAGCGTEGPGALWVDPSKFTFYHCKDLSRRWKELTARESDLRALIEKANESAAGAVIGSIAYRSDYEVALSEENCCSA